jgi:hypothetical protein
MKLPRGRTAIALFFLIVLGTGPSLAQQTPTKRNFETEINAAIEGAKIAAGFEFLLVL